MGGLGGGLSQYYSLSIRNGPALGWVEYDPGEKQAENIYPVIHAYGKPILLAHTFFFIRTSKFDLRLNVLIQILFLASKRS